MQLKGEKKILFYLEEGMNKHEIARNFRTNKAKFYNEVKISGNRRIAA
jgi:hypothetical protein